MEKIIKIKEKYIKYAENFEKESRKFSNMRLITALAAIGIILANFRKILTFPYNILAIAIIAAFIFSVIKEGKADKSKRESEEIVKLAELYEKRKNGEWKTFKENGSGFSDEYAFISDLQITGENSLFQFINCAVTEGGRKKLAGRLEKSMDIQNNEDADAIKREVSEYQDGVSEIAENPELILKFQEKIREIEDIENMDSSEEKDNFIMEHKFSRADFVISLILSVITIVTAVMAKADVHFLLALLPMVFIQFVSALMYQNRFAKEISSTGKNVRKLKSIQELVGIFREEEFKSKKMNELKKSLIASESVYEKLKKIDSLESFRKNFLMWFIGNIFLSLNRFIVREYGKIEKEDSMKMYESLKAAEDFEVLISLATVSLVKENTCRPVFTDNLEIKCTNAQHPMLTEDCCVGNDFESGRNINIITGSNMSGKTSFMKTIGVNMILAYSGAFVNAGEFSVPFMKIYTSINVKDDISRGISKFYAELLRLKDAVQSADRGERMVLFVDEIFSGTNYQDRMFGAKNIIEKLSRENVIGFITTHDFELCEIENENIVNYHFSEEYVDGKMEFSHKIRNGKCNGTNAVQLMRETGILC